MAARKAPVVTALESVEQTQEAIAGSTLAVLDVHQEWCGPCTVMEACFKKLSLEYGQTRLRFYSVDESSLPPGLLPSTGSHAPSTGSGGSCKPTLLLAKGGRMLLRISGANPPDLEAQIADAVPPAEGD